MLNGNERGNSNPTCLRRLRAPPRGRRTLLNPAHAGDVSGPCSLNAAGTGHPRGFSIYTNETTAYKSK